MNLHAYAYMYMFFFCDSSIICQPNMYLNSKPRAHSGVATITYLYMA